ncbi:MAG TPA: hypothetical protein VEC11_09765 [Allosphingosinicella sp.]|nr:hypothetical protein [Allosphingosinicella sp.]
MHLSPFDDLDRGTIRDRQRSSRRIGEILSFLFLVSVGMVATATSVRADALQQADAPIGIAATR